METLDYTSAYMMDYSIHKKEGLLKYNNIV